MWFRTTVLLVCTFFLANAGRFKTQGIKYFKNYNVIQRNASNLGMWPSSFNLATKAAIFANATCGENGREEFCRLVEDGKGRCGVCDHFSTDPNKKHPISYAIDGTNRWWQSPALFYGAEYEYVTITVDLKQVYQITDVIIKVANSPRPGTWILERSLNGENYKPWQYFARNDRECLEYFKIPGTKGKPHYFTDSEVICTSFYSKLTPLENGEIHVSLMFGRPGANETSPELLQFTKARYVRFRLMGLRGTVEPRPRWFLQDVWKGKKLFYTIRDISIVGHCVCNGHAENCRYNVASGRPECECAHHTCGPNCDRCCPLYNQRQWGPGTSRDAHQCLPCNCHGHATSCHYDENVDKAGLSIDVSGNYQGGGVCDNCAAHTTGVNCDQCMPGYYRPQEVEMDAEEPCLKCDCDLPGTSKTCIQEGEFAGKCNCLLGYEGDKCEFCARGFKRWPKCEPCPCDSRGVLEMADCEGDCTCKVNVEGKFCDRCKSGYFALKKDNSEGCISCYCSGVSSLCELAVMKPPKIQTLDNWFTTNLKMSEVAKPIRDSNGLFSLGGYELPNIESLYWMAPIEYLGNKLEYYSSVFIFKVQWVIMRGDTSGKPTRGPNIIMVGENGMRIAHGDDFFTTSNATFKIKMVENNWYHISPNKNEVSATLKRNKSLGESVNRKQFLSVLTNISHILLRATFHADQIESLLEEAMIYADGEYETVDVEKCSCPSGHLGLSCESCAFGYVKIKTNTTLNQEGYCGKCDCNGHSETCNPDSGECFCQHNTTGENCERCKAGFYGNPLRGTKEDCKKCACPLENDENNFSPSCQLDYLSENDEEKSNYVCTQCPKGYTGDHCEICDDGYFGNPLIIGATCKPCNCNGYPCDRITGQCLSCKGNTEGWRCEKCKPGFYGDALMSNCISCQCDPIGAVSKNCNNVTGQCTCKERFTDRTCNKCQVGYGNVTALCTPCDCHPVGSKSNICDQQTGLCECRKGVDGFHCDTCQNLHYGLSEDGCKECNCDKQGSQMQACDEKTGKCRCKPHYTGPKCDRCEDGYWKNNSVCIPCNCHVNGSRSTTCDPDTGLCPCKRGVEGQKCNSCQNKYYGSVTIGCKACDPCEKEGHICHPENGKCVCPQLTTGAKCERCGADAWGYEPGIGCKSCRCSTTGSASTQCDLVTGRCTCKIGFEGEKCDKCSFGYYNYPDCTKCNCNVAGTRPEDCSNGSCKCDHRKCRCKNNVEGPNCDRCKKNTYDLDPSNPQGCTNCFCSNRSTTCRASTFIWDQIRTASVENVKLQKCVNKMPCWSLPNKFTGDLIPSYGGYFRILSNSSQNRVYIIGNGITAEANTDQRGDIRITNVDWKLTSDSYPSKLPKECSTYLTRPCFMLILQNVSKILIEPVTSKQIKFSEVLLDKMSNTVGTSQASSVENCSCPKEYTSFSCQDPSTGYFRYYPKEFEPEYNYIDKTIGVAKPCQCNNRSNICDKQTGHCRDCVGFTTGSHCELCKEGYYRNSSGGCSPCLCPSEEQNFAKNCTIIGGTRKQFKCTCKTGYSGSKCNECSKGYWGNLLQKGGTCKPCKCNSHGSESLQCDKRTGHCKCKSGFTGVKCSKCSSPRQIIQNGVCVPCDECTQILFNTLDGLSKGLNETLGIFENGLGPPWTLLNSTLNRYGLLMLRFKNLEIAKNLLQNINIPKIENKLEQIKEKVLEQNRMLTLQKDFADRVQEESIMLSENIQDLDNRSNIIINNVNKFGQSHIDIREALQEAEELLKDIYSISKEIPSSDRYEDVYNKCDQLFKGINDTYNVDLNSKKIMAKLDELKSKLADLDIILRRISMINEFVKNKNKQNANGIVDLNTTINEINNKNLIINDDVGDLLKKINVTDDLLREMKKIYKHLSQLDVEKATNDIDKDDVAQVYDTLSIVREHVKKLQNKIKNYKNLFNFTSEEWTKIDASGAYDNIAKGIQLARREADHARNITVDILNKIYPSDDDSLSDKANLAKAFSDRIQKRVINLENLTDDLRKNTENLEDLKHDIQINGKNNNELNAFLRDLRQNISNQTKDIHNLEKMKSNVRNISSLISSIEQGIKDTNVTMQYEVTKTYQKYLDLVSSDEIVNFLKNINATKKQFEEITIFSNLTAIDRIKDANANKFNNTKRNLEIIQKEISQLIDNINYANEQVEAVEYGVDIGKCERYYKLQNDILRSLEINFSCNGTCNLFELNNSDNEKIKISYENNMINVLWKKHTRKINSSNSVILKRVGSMIEMKTENETLSFYDDEPFHIEGKHYLKIGKLTNKQNVSGQCLRRIVLNGQTIGLWKFDRSKGNCSACYRNVSTDGLVDVFFRGNSYRSVQKDSVEKLRPDNLNFVFSFATFDENSLIFVSQDPSSNCSFVALRLSNGKLRVEIRHYDGSENSLISEKKYNNGVDTKVEMSMVYNRNNGQQTYFLKVLVPQGEQPMSKSIPLKRQNVHKIKKSNIFIGGVPSVSDRSCLPANIIPFLGNLNVTGLDVGSQSTTSYNIEPRTNLGFYKAWFPEGKGYIDLEFQHDLESPQSISFLLRPVEVHGVVMNINNAINVSLENSSVVFRIQNKTELEFRPVCANSSQFIKITRTNISVNNDIKNVTLDLDFNNKGKIRFLLGKSTFVGSVSDIFVDNRPVLFDSSTVKKFAKVEIGRDHLSTFSFKNKCMTDMQNTERYFRIPDYKTEPQAFKFGDKPNSFVFIKNSLMGKKCVLEFQFRTFYPNGLLFLSDSHSFRGNTSFYTILEIRGGDLRLQVQGHKTKAMNISHKINDGLWHNVQVEQTFGKRKIRIVVKLDKKWKIKDRIPRNNFNGGLYVGGVASNVAIPKKMKNELHPFRGCIRSLKINKNLQVVKNNNNIFYNNIGQCFQKVEEGAYFGGDAFAIYKYDFKVNKFLELSFEFKTGEPNGILLSVSNLGNSPALSVELQNGAVVMMIDMGNGVISKVTNSPHSDLSLANNEWHNITALYSSSELTVNVDGIRKSWVQSDINSMVDEIEAPLYLGGLPNNAPSGTLEIKENFKGCIRKFKIEDNIKDWTDMKKLRNVQLNSCLA